MYTQGLNESGAGKRNTHTRLLDGGLEKKINKFFPMAVDKRVRGTTNYKKEFFVRFPTLCVINTCLCVWRNIFLMFHKKK